MSAASCLLTEDQFLCSICLDVFTDPVSTPCGHNFCKTCITDHWDSSVQCQCPNCKKVFNTRPELQVNTFISEMAAQFRQSAQQEASSSSSSEQQVSKPADVPCDVCTGTKLKALKSCLVCLDSYCETHLEPHLTRSGLKRHQLIDPVENLEGRMCTKHDKLLELFCKNDQTCICMLCTVSDHKLHDVVPLKEEYEGKKAELGKTEAEIQQMIQKRQLKIQEIKHSVELSEEDADREIAGGVQVFTALKESVERSQAELIDTIKEKQRKMEKQAEGFIKELEQEISELKKRSTEVEQLSQSEDHLHLLQSFTSLNAAPPTRDWTQVSVRPPSFEGTVVRAVTQLEETLSKPMKKLRAEAELKRVQQSAVEVTLHTDTLTALREQLKKLRAEVNLKRVQRSAALSEQMKKREETLSEQMKREETLSEQMKKREETLSEQMKKREETLREQLKKLQAEADLKRVQRSAALSEQMKQEETLKKLRAEARAEKGPEVCSPQ
ncbi:E3 ubiquitin/ISG15 ligase TRIM25-like [Sander lucioperca]|uniref:E3 ubiquitin/ISG15 ligase TRIM25-like n=1 Tax=Sander lucioperca TaxID=283035 RepID=A0A8C9YPN7_SANLU|nr:E3 ubiquitin/ISG15 ligase TRIM25-like [Sander lucioperca]